MARLAANRATHLTPQEIAREVLRQFDSGQDEPSIRSLASALQVAPTAIYHHFPSRAAILQAAVELVWNQTTAELLKLLPNPLEADPLEVLVAGGIATRRAWLEHYRLAPYMAASPEANEFTDNALALWGTLFERLGLEGEQAAAAFHSYCTYMIGGVLFAATRLATNEKLARPSSERSTPAGRRFQSQPPPGVERRTTRATRLSMDQMMDLSTVDPRRDEELFAQGLRRLINSLIIGPQSGPRD
jgi:AcrR family transcriptional regulator